MGRIKWGIAVGVLALLAVVFFKFNEKGDGYTEKKFLFDTYCTITAYGDDAEDAVANAFSEVQKIHDATNVFSESSEVYKINSAKAGEVISLSDDLTLIMETVVQIEKESGRSFDSSIAPVVLLWDFSGEGKVPSKEAIDEAMRLTGEGKFIFDSKNKTLVKTDDNAKIDLGGAAKGYAADKAVEVIRAEETTGKDVSGAVIDFGGNIVCYGKNPNSDDGKWRIGVQKPFAPTGEYDEDKIIEMTSGAVVTSGTYQRYFEKDGNMYHHIIDPKTGYPAERDYNSVTVVAENSLIGDCLSTACFVMGREEGKKLAEKFGIEIYFD